MWNKIYLVLLLVCLLTMGVLLYLPFSWLGSVTKPEIVAVNFTHYANISRVFLFASSLVLLIAGNVVLFKNRKSWALWTTLFYFAAFMLAEGFWLEPQFFQYQQSNNLTESSFYFGSIIAIIFVVIAAIVVFFNQYLVGKIVAKLAPETVLPENTAGKFPSKKDTI